MKFEANKLEIQTPKKRTCVLSQTYLRFVSNVLVFCLKRTCVLFQTYLRFDSNVLAF